MEFLQLKLSWVSKDDITKQEISHDTVYYDLHTWWNLENVEKFTTLTFSNYPFQVNLKKINNNNKRFFSLLSLKRYLK